MGKNPPWTILSLLQWTASYFKRHAIDSPRASAEILLAYVLEVRRIDLYLQYDRPLMPLELGHYKQLIKRRIDREPVAYIVGQKEFWSLPFDVGPDVLIPRPDSECLVETVLDILAAHADETTWRILELGTGCGALIVSLAFEQSSHCFYATDLHPEAVFIARNNAVMNACQGIQFFVGDWLHAISAKHAAFDVILSNPPYVPTAEIDGLQPEIRRYEPQKALNGGRDGLEGIRHLIDHSADFLRSGGFLMMEIGHDQKAAVDKMAAAHPAWSAPTFRKDDNGRDRVVCLQKKGAA